MKKANLLAAACCLAVPFVVCGGGFVAALIDPEWAVHTAHYTRNFHLLSALKLLIFFGSLGLVGFLLVLAAYFLLTAKRDPDPWQRFVGSMSRTARAAFELAFFIAAWTVSYWAMVLLRNVLIYCGSLATGATVAQIVAQQNTMSGMYAFSEGLEVAFLVVLIYFSRIFFGATYRYILPGSFRKGVS